MSNQGRVRRVRVIKDKAKYRRHRLRKLLQLLLKLGIYGVIIVGAILFIWLGLDMLFRPRPQD